MTDRPELHLVPGGEADEDAPEPDLVAPSADATDVAPEPDPVASSADADAAPDDVAPESRDPLLARAERIADLPLAERPAAFDGLNRAVVGELNHLDEG